MAQTQLFLLDDNVTPTPGVVHVIGNRSDDQEHDNVLIQDLIESGAWSDYNLLLEARESLREEVREACSDPHSFFAHESRAALKLVSDRLRVFFA